jgi:hypothetical protein
MLEDFAYQQSFFSFDYLVCDSILQKEIHSFRKTQVVSSETFILFGSSPEELLIHQLLLGLRIKLGLFGYLLEVLLRIRATEMEKPLKFS